MCLVMNAKSTISSLNYFTVCFPGVLDKSTFIQRVCSDRSSDLTDGFGSSSINCSMLSLTGNSCGKRISAMSQQLVIAQKRI